MKEVEDKLKKYFSMTERALKKIKISKKLTNKEKKTAENFIKISKCYYNDAKYFEKRKDKANAFAAVCYAHAFLDAGCIAGYFDVKDSKLFMVD